MGKPAFDLTKVSAQDVYPEGKFRCRITGAEEYPKGEGKLADDGSIIGETKDDGSPKYGWARVGFRFIEHPNNYTVDPKSGKTVVLVGRTAFFNFSYEIQRTIRELFDNTGTPADQPYEALKDKECDITLKNKPDKKEPDIIRTNISRVSVALDK